VYFADRSAGSVERVTVWSMSKAKVDAVVAVAMTSGVVLGCLVVSRSGEQRPLDSAGFALLVVTGAALAWRRSRPVPAAVVAGTACVAYYALLYPGIFAAAPVLLAVYTVVSRGFRWAGVLIAVGFVVAFYLAIAVARSDYALHDGVLWQAGFLVTVVAIGQTVATHRAYLREVELRVAEGERTREEAALRRAGEERLWIAQELHDTLTHTISVMNVQAGVAGHLIDHDPGQVRILTSDQFTHCGRIARACRVSQSGIGPCRRWTRTQLAGPGNNARCVPRRRMGLR
jgi:signal transduction histidine kinase